VYIHTKHSQKERERESKRGMRRGERESKRGMRRDEREERENTNTMKIDTIHHYT
jgi:hypothetical protein